MYSDIAKRFYKLPYELQIMVMEHSNIQLCILLGYDDLAKKILKDSQNVQYNAVMTEDYVTVKWLCNNNLTNGKEPMYAVKNELIFILIFMYEICGIRGIAKKVMTFAAKCGSLNIIRYLARKNNYNTY